MMCWEEIFWMGRYGYQPIGDCSPVARNDTYFFGDLTAESTPHRPSHLCRKCICGLSPGERKLQYGQLLRPPGEGFAKD